MYPEHDPAREEAGEFGHMTTVTIDPKNLPSVFKLTDARKADLGEHPALLPGFLYVGVTVFYSEPGLGKSMLSGQVEEHLAFGRPFGPWLPERPVRCMVIDLEGDMRLASDRSLRITPFGLLASDEDRDMPADVLYATEWPGGSFIERVEVLRQRLEAARDAGQPFEYVRIDTMRLFLGSKPHGVNAYEWDAHCVGVLNRMALHFDAVFVLVHHTNKGGELSGSTGVAGSAVAIVQIKRNPDNDDECLLLSHKVRVDTDFRYALAMDDRGRWMFTEEITPTQAQLGGTKRAIVNQLTRRGPLVLGDLRETLADTSLNTIKSALRRLAHENIAVYRRGAWQLTQTTVADHPKCMACSEPMEVYAPGQTAHPTCTESPFLDATVTKFLGTPLVAIPAQAGPELAESGDFPNTGKSPNEASPEEEHEDEGEDVHPEAQRFPSYDRLKESIGRSRMKPVLRVPREERESAPWTYVTNRLDGSFNTKRDARPVPDGTTHVVLFDRNGSFPSAMSSVPVAANKLRHTGPLSVLEREGLSGLFRMVVAEWDADRWNMPHPLGRAVLAPDADGAVWLTGPHVELLDKLASQGRMKVSTCLESWSGRRVTNLFEPFSAWARTVRQETARADKETQQAAKNAVVVAIRSLHPIKSRSPFWRPDWHKAVMAEASVRHWVMADRAVQAGAALLSIGATDEVTFAVPADADPQLWVPQPYRLGAGFGQIKRKDLTIDKVDHPSPVPLDVWESRRG